MKNLLSILVLFSLCFASCKKDKSADILPVEDTPTLCDDAQAYMYDVIWYRVDDPSHTLYFQENGVFRISDMVQKDWYFSGDLCEKVVIYISLTPFELNIVSVTEDKFIYEYGGYERVFLKTP